MLFLSLLPAGRADRWILRSIFRVIAQLKGTSSSFHFLVPLRVLKTQFHIIVSEMGCQCLPRPQALCHYASRGHAPPPGVWGAPTPKKVRVPAPRYSVLSMVSCYCATSSLDMLCISFMVLVQLGDAITGRRAVQACFQYHWMEWISPIGILLIFYINVWLVNKCEHVAQILL